MTGNMNRRVFLGTSALAAIAAGTPKALAFAALVVAGGIVRMLCEESMLVRQYPEYADYMRNTSRSIPGLF